MNISFRHYQHAQDYQRVSQFLIAHYRAGQAPPCNWLEPAWEYMHYHPALDAEHMDKFGIWEIGDEIAAVCHYEWHLGEAFFQFHPEFHSLHE